MIHHELGHNYYQRAYKTCRLTRDGANDGFHEADRRYHSLSVTPVYLVKYRNCRTRAPDANRVTWACSSGRARKVAFLPFGLLVDQWRWQFFSGKGHAGPTTTKRGGRSTEVSGRGATVAERRGVLRSRRQISVPGNTSVHALFPLPHILQFQFHRALSKTAGCRRPLHRMLDLREQGGGPAPGRDAQDGRVESPGRMRSKVLTGRRQMDATAIGNYFAPLKLWLNSQLEGQPTGW